MKKIQLIFYYFFIAIIFTGILYACEEKDDVNPNSDQEENSDDNNTNGVSAQFSPADTQHVVVGGEITFEVEDDSEITNVEWSFEGGSPNESTEKSVTVTYESTNNSPFDVTLIVKGDNGSDTLTREDLIYVSRDFTDNLDLSNTEKLKLFRSGDVVDSIYNFQAGGDTVFVKPLESDNMQVNNKHFFTTISQIQKIGSKFIFSGDFSTSNPESSTTSKLVVDPQSGSVSLMSDSEMGFDESITEEVDGNMIEYHEKLDEYTVEGVDDGDNWTGHGYDIGEKFTFNGIEITKDELDDALNDRGWNECDFYIYRQMYVNDNIIYGIFDCGSGREGSQGSAISIAFYNIETNSKYVKFGGAMQPFHADNGRYDLVYTFHMKNDGYKAEEKYDMHTHYIDYKDYSITNVFQGTIKNNLQWNQHKENYSPYFMYHVKVERDYYINDEYQGKYNCDRTGFIILMDDTNEGNNTKIEKVVPFGEYVYVFTKSYHTVSSKVIKFPVSYFKENVTGENHWSIEEGYKYIELSNLPSEVSTIMEKETATTYKQNGMWVIEATDGSMKYIGSDGSVQSATAVEGDEISF